VSHAPAPPRAPRPPFDPTPHRAALAAIIEAVADDPRLDARRLDRIVKRHPKEGRGLFSKTEIIAGFRAFGREVAPLPEAEFLERLRLRPVRTLSGVTPVTVLTKPFPCPGRCVFCPNDVRMPKSYLADEPGAQRAEDNRFDPYLQTWNRLAAYRSMGHPTDKVELIVLGGTWSHYPEPYQVWFVRRCLEALTDFGDGRDGRGTAGAAAADYRALAPLDGRALAAGAYNTAVRRHLAAANGPTLLHASERAHEDPSHTSHDEHESQESPESLQSAWEALAAAQRRGETSATRCVGLAFETRPDAVDADEVRRLRRLGATKVQLGVQSLQDAVLDASRRGHDVAASRRAVHRLRGAGFKIHAHWMPNLPGSDPARDAADFERLFADAGFRPDELKLYPCLLVPSAELAALHARGAWSPYDDATLVELLAGCMARTPRWCRLTRVVRDFSAADVAAGTHTANLREVAERALAERGGRAVEIRSREIRARPAQRGALRLAVHGYATSVGVERFLEWVTPDDRVVGFLRLSLPGAGHAPPLDELTGCAVIREVHVYGASAPLGDRPAGAAQHAGLGGALVEEAARLARDAGHARLAVISSVGTRAWYRRLGFRDGPLYQHRALRAGDRAVSRGTCRETGSGARRDERIPWRAPSSRSCARC